MKAILFSCLLVLALATTAFADGHMKIQVGERKELQNGASAYPINCVGATGTISYHVDGLPKGASFQDNHLILPSNIVPGTYSVTVTATDPFGHETSQVIRLSVVENQSANAGSNAGSNAGANAGANAEQTATVDQRLSQILNTYSTVSEYKISYQGNTYPTTDFPTGATGDNLNTDVVYINRVAEVSTENRNTITADYVSLIAASERYQTAVKSVTNLLKIIDQARANKAQAQADLATYTQRYDDAVKRQREAQELIISIEIKITQIRSAINAAQDRLGGINAQIADVQATIGDLEDRNRELDNLIDEYEAKRAGLIAQLADINDEITALIEERRAHQDKCAQIKANLEKAQVELQEKRDALANLRRNIADAEADLKAKTAEVERLAAALEAAKAAQAEANARLTDLRGQAETLPGQIDALIARINALTIQYEDCLAKVADLTARIDALRTNDITRLENEIADIEAKLREYNRERGDNKAKIGEYQVKLESLISQRGDLEDTLNYLRTQLTKYQEELRAAYTAGNDANNNVIIAKQNLVAVNARWEQECQVEEEATFNLEKARAEQELARLALEELVAHYSNALPYSIVPNANGVGRGSPSGNNPAGSPLGQATGSTTRIQIDDWTHYLSSAFGKGINPTLDGNINYLYPFTMGEQNGLRGGNNICNQNGPVRAIEGEITGMRNGKIHVHANGQNYDVNYAGCTRFAANKANYQPRVGDRMIAKGTTHGHEMNCQQAVAISQ